MNFPATEETTVWFNRVLNIVHTNAPRSKIILVRGPEDIVPAIERVLGKTCRLEEPLTAAQQRLPADATPTSAESSACPSEVHPARRHSKYYLAYQMIIEQRAEREKVKETLWRGESM